MEQKDNSKIIPESIYTAQTSVKRQRGTFPRLSFRKALELLAAIFELGQGEPVRRLKVFDYLKKSPESGPSRMLVTVSSMYNLTSGSYKAERLSATDTGESVITATSNKSKATLIFNILFSNKIFSGFIDHWKDKSIPSDDIAEDWLLREYKLTVRDAQSYWEVIKENIKDYNLTQILSGKEVIIPKEVALESLEGDDGDSLQEVPTPTSAESKSAVQISTDGKRQSMNMPKPFGSQIAERDFKYGRGRLILPAEMTKIEIGKLKLLIDSMVSEVNE